MEGRRLVWAEKYFSREKNHASGQARPLPPSGFLTILWICVGTPEMACETRGVG